MTFGENFTDAIVGESLILETFVLTESVFVRLALGQMDDGKATYSQPNICNYTNMGLSEV